MHNKQYGEIINGLTELEKIALTKTLDNGLTELEKTVLVKALRLPVIIPPANSKSLVELGLLIPYSGTLPTMYYVATDFARVILSNS